MAHVRLPQSTIDALSRPIEEDFDEALITLFDWFQHPELDEPEPLDLEELAQLH